MLFENYEKIFTRVARNCILEEAAKFNANDYWLKRSQIGEQMFKRLKATMGELYTDITGFMMIKIELPQTYDAAIINTEVVN